MADERKRCLEEICGAYDGHSPLCPRGSAEQKTRQLSSYVARNRKLAEMWVRARDNALMWHGKWAIVKLENNRLRQKLARLTKREKAEIEE